MSANGGQFAVRVLADPDPAGEGVVNALARAFRDAPLNVAVLGGDDRRRTRANRHGMRGLLASARGGAVVWTEGSSAPAGALIGVRPACHPLPPPPLGSQLRSLLGQGWRATRRWGEAYRSLAEIHPEDPHWYLAVLGVDPDHQGRGVGSALLAAFLARVDDERQPAYLETDRERNLAFYQRAGFETVRETRILDVPVWCMWRTAK